MKIAGKRVRKIYFEKMSSLIKKGAEVLEFQSFLGEKSQNFRTRVFWKNRQYLTCHANPFPFIRQESGQLIDDVSVTEIPAKKAYHPS
jgi:hypothetical protein